TDYTVSYSNNTDVGTAGVTITGTGNYSGSLETSFEIIPIDTSGLNLDPIADQLFNGSELTPSVHVTDGDTTLAEGTDYTVSYSNNTGVGTAMVTVELQNGYSGILETTFEITPKDVSALTIDPVSDREYTGLAITPSTSLQNGGVSLTEGTDYTVSYSNNTDVGTAGVTITGTGNYSGSLETTFEITPKDVS
ncbi:hypothetical protein ACFSVN_05005, partial [Gracilimonas halophila]